MLLGCLRGGFRAPGYGAALITRVFRTFSYVAVFSDCSMRLSMLQPSLRFYACIYITAFSNWVFHALIYVGALSDRVFHAHIYDATLSKYVPCAYLYCSPFECSMRIPILQLFLTELSMRISMLQCSMRLARFI